MHSIHFRSRSFRSGFFLYYPHANTTPGSGTTTGPQAGIPRAGLPSSDTQSGRTAPPAQHNIVDAAVFDWYNESGNSGIQNSHTQPNSTSNVDTDIDAFVSDWYDGKKSKPITSQPTDSSQKLFDEDGIYDFLENPYLDEGDGKTIGIEDYEKIYDASHHNVGKSKVMLGKYDSGGPNSYITKAGNDYEYFDLGKDWNIIKGKLSIASEYLENALDENQKKLFQDYQASKADVETLIQVEVYMQGSQFGFELTKELTAEKKTDKDDRLLENINEYLK